VTRGAFKSLAGLSVQLVGIVIALIAISLVLCACADAIALLMGIFMYSAAPRPIPPNSLPSGWASLKCTGCGKGGCDVLTIHSSPGRWMPFTSLNLRGRLSKYHMGPVPKMGIVAKEEK
jgi:hypothetical protein